MALKSIFRFRTLRPKVQRYVSVWYDGGETFSNQFPSPGHPRAYSPRPPKPDSLLNNKVPVTQLRRFAASSIGFNMEPMIKMLLTLT